jgi:hypothetical protein
MERHDGNAPPITAALVIAGLWMRVGFGAAFAALAAPLLVLRDGLAPGDGLALTLLAAGVAWLAWRRVHVLLDDAPVAPDAPAVPRGATPRRATA